MQAMPCKAISEALAWICRAKDAFRNYSCRFLHGTIVQELPFEATAPAFRMELSCKSFLAMLFLKPWHGTVVQRLPCKAMSHSLAWNPWAKAALQSNFVSFRIELSCETALFPNFCTELSCNSCLEKLFPEFCMGLSYRNRLVKLVFSSCMRLCKHFLPKLFLKCLG